MDFLWDVADEIRRTGSYGNKRSEKYQLRSREIDLERVRLLQKMIDNPAYVINNESKAVIMHEAFKILSGHENLAILPESTEKWYSAKDIGERFGISALKVGRISNEYGLKSPEGESGYCGYYGCWIMSKSEYSPRGVQSFVYNNNALRWFESYLGKE